ncbi:uncharacterized protein PHACADRAFT_264029 [Phanerochaete carnosa HHB-10118-sp]|uniref:Uncharacterized protein n=1 Tax=Phanerochaete carnosa (strain HHB-10118-sp) TaxID=650164 RepID=K5VVP2_PHACS|nr:uncharacterized protein PHACADRAFT_264029 [Phanerochaete carnosa HHB-10118-sp]EKM50649.1 hypothetical protein PHACADRAFT_264029 [Phanerochaete carnosa HHB-10118-sp]
MLPEEADIDPMFWGYCVGGFVVSIDVAEAFARRSDIGVLELIDRFRNAKKEDYDRQGWWKLSESPINASKRINNWLLDRHPDDFASLPFPGVQVVFFYWRQEEREKWNARQKDLGSPPKLADGWYLLFKCRDAYTLDELVRVRSVDSVEETEKRKFREYLLNDLQVLGSETKAEGREQALPWISLFDYSGLCFVWFRPGGRRDKDIRHIVDPEEKQAYFKKFFETQRRQVDAIMAERAG